jgi:hypothetical protein
MFFRSKLLDHSTLLTVNILDSGTTIAYGGGKTALSATAAADVLNGAEVRKGVRQLRAANAMPISGGYFAWVIHPNNSYDLQSDTASGRMG